MRGKSPYIPGRYLYTFVNRAAIGDAFIAVVLQLGRCCEGLSGYLVQGNLTQRLFERSYSRSSNAINSSRRSYNRFGFRGECFAKEYAVMIGSATVEST